VRTSATTHNNSDDRPGRIDSSVEFVPALVSSAPRTATISFDLNPGVVSRLKAMRAPGESYRAGRR
jgi:hypothetical protein